MLTLGAVESVNVRHENHTCGDSWVDRSSPWIRGPVSIMTALPLRTEGSETRGPWGGGVHRNQRWGWWGCKVRKMARKASSPQPAGETQHWGQFASFGAKREWIFFYSTLFLVLYYSNTRKWIQLFKYCYFIATCTSMYNMLHTQGTSINHLYFEKWNLTISYFQEHSP